MIRNGENEAYVVSNSIPTEVVRSHAIVSSKPERAILIEALSKVPIYGLTILTSKRNPAILDEPGPPFNQMPHGSVLLASVSDPFCFSAAQKKSVSFG